MADGIRFDNWMSSNDALMWAIERDPHQRSTIVSVMVLEQAPDLPRFHASIQRMVRAIPRLRQRVVPDPMGLAPPAWETDPNFDPDYHVRSLTVAATDGPDEPLAGLLRVAATVGVQAFDKDRPLWETYLVGGLPEGQVGIVMKLHHAISDGVGLVRMSRYFIDLERNPPVPVDLQREAHEAPVRNDMTRAIDALRHRLGQNLGLAMGAGRLALRGARDLATEPLATATRVRDTLASVARLTRGEGAPLSPVMTGRSLTSDFRSLSVPLADLKAAAKVAGGTVNDAFVAAVAGGLGRYHQRHHRPVPALRMQMPVNVRDLGADDSRAGNQFVPVRLEVPLDLADPVARMAAVRTRVQEQLAEPALPLFNEISGALALLPDAVATSVAAGMTRSVDFTTSNVPGIPVPIYVSGAQVLTQIGFGPVAGAALNATATSYNGRFIISLNCDRAAVPDADLLAACIQQGLDEVLALVSSSNAAAAGAPAAVEA